MERIARAIRPLSTAPDEDVLLVLRRALFAWLIADGDMHLKNMALLKISEPGSAQFTSVRIAPLYDAVTTRVFPRLERDRMAMKLSGKDDRLRRADFKAFASTAGLRVGDADAVMDELITALSGGLDRLELPSALSDGSHGAEMAERMRESVQERIHGFAG